MSRMSRNSHKTSNTYMAKKPHCKVCQDSGKSEREYTSHWVKDLSGKITCPTLLKMECRRCFRLGHTVKFCTTNIEKNNKKQLNIKKVDTTTKTLQKTNKSVNLFDLLEKEDDNTTTVVCVQACLPPSIEYAVEPKKNSWANIAATLPKTKEDCSSIYVELGSVGLQHIVKKDKAIPEKKQERIPVPVPKTWTLFDHNWADWPSDSEDEDEFIRCHSSSHQRWQSSN